MNPLLIPGMGIVVLALAFYLFFDSKEDLFLSIAERIAPVERKKIKERIAGASSGSILQAFIDALFDVCEAHPLLRTADEPDIMFRVHAKIRPERLQEHIGRDDRFILEFLQAIAPSSKRDPSSLDPWITAIQTVFLLYLHRDEVGRDYKPGMKLLIELLNAGGKEYCSGNGS